MGKLATTGIEEASTVLTGTFTGTGQSTAVNLFGDFNVALWGTFSATVGIQQSFDGGTTWINAATDGTGTAASYTGAVAVAGTEPEPAVLYRFNCTAFTSGTVNYRFSAGPRLT